LGVGATVTIRAAVVGVAWRIGAAHLLVGCRAISVSRKRAAVAAGEGRRREQRRKRGV